MTVPVQNQVWLQLYAQYSLGRIDNNIVMLSHQLVQLCISMYFVLHTRPDTFEDNPLLHMKQCHIQTNGVGKKDQMGHCLYIGQLIFQSLTFAKHWRNVNARMNEVGDALAPDNHVLHYVLHVNVTMMKCNWAQ